MAGALRRGGASGPDSTGKESEREEPVKVSTRWFRNSPGTQRLVPRDSPETAPHVWGQ